MHLFLESRKSHLSPRLRSWDPWCRDAWILSTLIGAARGVPSHIHLASALKLPIWLTLLFPQPPRCALLAPRTSTLQNHADVAVQCGLTIGYSWLETLDRATQSCSAYQSFRDLLATYTERLVSRIHFTPSTIIHASCAECSASAPQLTFRGIKDVAAYRYTL